MSAFSAGMVLGWTSPILDYLTEGKYNNISINQTQMGCIGMCHILRSNFGNPLHQLTGSFATFGAMAMCIPTGFICDLIGRKNALLLLVVFYIGGWGLIIWAKNILMLYFGRYVQSFRNLNITDMKSYWIDRLITGMAVGACCVAAPLYNGEIAHQSIRGALGSLFQLMIVTGIFVAYLLGECLIPLQV